MCIKHEGPRFKDVWEVTGVPGREAILIHQGNTMRDTDGCILVGEQFTQFGELPGVNNSVATLNHLRDIMPDKFWLVVEDAI